MWLHSSLPTEALLIGTLSSKMHPRRWNQTKGTPTNQSGILFMRIHLNNLLNIPVKFIHLRIVKYLSSHSLWLSSHLVVVGSRESRGIGRYLLPRRMTIKRLSAQQHSYGVNPFSARKDQSRKAGLFCNSSKQQQQQQHEHHHELSNSKGS